MIIFSHEFNDGFEDFFRIEFVDFLDEGGAFFLVKKRVLGMI